MFEFDAGKLIIIGIVALIVIGPKELPRVMRTVGQAVGKMRRLATEFQSQFMDAMREADMADLKAEAAKLAEQAKIDVAFNPVADVKASLTDALQLPSPEPGEAKASETAADEVLTSKAESGEEAPQADHGETTPVTIYKGEAPAPAAESAPISTVEPAGAPEETPVKPAAADEPREEAVAPVRVAAMPAEPAAPEPLPLRTSA